MAAYDHWGVDCLHQFDGMFAFALYDNETKELFCARDRFGEKPFHYSFTELFFAFGSEMKSLWAAGIDTSIDDYSIYLFLNMNLHEDPMDKTRTFYRNIKRLKPAHYIKIKRGDPIQQICYWKLPLTLKSNDLSFEEACNQFRQMFETSVTLRLRTDVPLGTSLSGGIDSSAVSLVMHKLKDPQGQQKCFSARFQDPQVD